MDAERIAEIDREYSNLCTMLGDNLIRSEQLQAEVIRIQTSDASLRARISELMEQKRQIIAQVPVPTPSALEVT